MIDTKNEMKRSIDGLGTQVNDLERNLRAAFATEIAGLRETTLADVKASQHETRTSSHNAGRRASEAAAAVAELRRDVDRLHHGLEGLREDVVTVLEALQAMAPARVPAAAASAEDPRPEPAGTSTGHEPDSVALPEQKQAPDHEPAPQAEPAAAKISAHNSPGGDEPAVSTGFDASSADEDEADQSLAEAELSTSEADGHDEGKHDVPHAALEASEQGVSDPVQEPNPLTRAGRVWAIMRAGRVASATLVCHRDTWEFVAAQAGSHPHFRTPALEERANGLVAAVLSGRSLVAVLLALYRVANASVHKPDGEVSEELAAYADWAMASQVYYATARVLSGAYHVEGDPVVVTIDSRLPGQTRMNMNG
ncbi:hypothetical protein [Streptomyces chrestomyceticus]|uniref:hypothetical protein n=1 Tax=Streptomyces chrestomyceticus TaxID=68185 RepID=UPI0019CF6F4E|nr:hypothetical protein [Streptomyces chrestomyceticus]